MVNPFPHVIGGSVIQQQGGLILFLIFFLNMNRLLQSLVTLVFNAITTFFCCKIVFKSCVSKFVFNATIVDVTMGNFSGGNVKSLLSIFLSHLLFPIATTPCTPYIANTFGLCLQT